MTENNVLSHSIETSLGANERESLDRPAWTSEQSTGMFHSAEHPFWNKFRWRKRSRRKEERR